MRLSPAVSAQQIERNERSGADQNKHSLPRTDLAEHAEVLKVLPKPNQQVFELLPLCK